MPNCLETYDLAVTASACEVFASDMIAAVPIFYERFYDYGDIKFSKPLDTVVSSDFLIGNNLTFRATIPRKIFIVGEAIDVNLVIDNTSTWRVVKGYYKLIGEVGTKNKTMVTNMISIAAQYIFIH